MSFDHGIFVCTLPVLKKFFKQWNSEDIRLSRSERLEFKEHKHPYDSVNYLDRWVYLYQKNRASLPPEVRETVVELHEYVLWQRLDNGKGVNDCKLEKADFALNPRRCKKLWASLQKVKPKLVAQALFEPPNESPDYLESPEELEILLKVYWKAVKDAATCNRWLVGITFV
jgi:hypothetical protein